MDQARRFRAVSGAHALWRRAGLKASEAMLKKLEGVGRIPEWEHMVKPTQADTYAVWARWDLNAQRAMRAMLKTMHGSYRKEKQEGINKAVQNRSDEYAAGRQLRQTDCKLD